MSFAIRGIVEGFYGRLWRWSERRRVTDAIASAGFNTYAYAPKEDRWQNAGWREPYPDDERRELEAFVGHCGDIGMAPWLGLRPVGISYADDDDLARLVEKLRRLLDLGPERILLLTDDIPSQLDTRSGGRFRRLVDAHAWLIGEVIERTPIEPNRLAFVPTAYHGFDASYLEPLGSSVDRSIDVCWTGSDVFVGEMTAEQVERVAGIIGRPPLVWDNYPVNDEPDRHELRMGPIRGRDPRLAETTRGVLVNPALEPESTIVPLLTWGAFLADPAGYDADAAWQEALRSLAGNERDAAAVATIAAARDRSILDQGWNAPSASALQEAVHRLDALENRALAAELRGFV